jgi:EAL domain-containing protein (putative c-di-GMP-specific phosphodiesterase class I)
MAHDLNYKVVAEGIETKEQLEYLQKNSCEGGQGFLLCVPLPPEQVSKIIRDKEI